MASTIEQLRSRLNTEILSTNNDNLIELWRRYITHMDASIERMKQNGQYVKEDTRIGVIIGAAVNELLKTEGGSIL